MEVELISEVVATFNIYNINRRLPDLLQWLSETKSDIVCSARVRAMKAENVNRERAPQEGMVGELGRPLITVIYPLFDIRQSAANAVRTWTERQTLSRERYRVFVLSPEESTAHEHSPHEVLGDGDRLIEVPEGNDAGMWNAGAARATTPWLVFVESHCLADPTCLEQAAAWISAGHGMVGNFTVLHSDAHLLARLADRWFAHIQSVWRSPGEWPRVHRSGFVIRADVFSRVGGFGSEYGQFAPALLSARLHSIGARVDYVPNAAVLHLDDETTHDHHYDTADYAIGEIACRSRQDQVFFERYFGHSDLWSNRLCRTWSMQRRIVRALAAACLSNPRQLRSLVNILVLQVLPSLLQGASVWHVMQRALIKLDEFAIDHLPLPEKLRWARFLRAHRRVTTQAQCDWVRKYRDVRAPREAPVSLPIEKVTPSDLGGAHGLEQFDTRNFRWTWPMFALRVASTATSLQLSIDTGGLRGNPLDCVIAVVIGRRVLPRSELSANAGVLHIALPGVLVSTANDIFVICEPLIPSQTGSSDGRHLGLPIFTITLS